MQPMKDSLKNIKEAAGVMEFMTCPISDAAQQAGISHTAIQKEIDSGRLLFVEHHSRRYVIKASLMDYINRKRAPKPRNGGGR